MVAWSSDSRLLVSGSKDSTLKLWSMNEIRRWQQEAVAPGLSDQPQAKKWKVSPADRKLEAENLILARDGTKSMCKQKSSTHPNSPHQRKRHLVSDLPGHADAVYALDWSPDGLFVASGGKDKLLKL
ncbi:unnamed protein product [Protopolystoma xenopodis]|uniref:Anaphase-promoting complex subunit 4 WD40 domain-containing protein n=1 Tax=Protopolystoma xenopodis TaxID=117903 RepID=A0A3S5C307_9PLAT|nr:unnamed protein product [Protopolystoma xenopodis]